MTPRETINSIIDLLDQAIVDLDVCVGEDEDGAMVEARDALHDASITLRDALREVD